MARGTAGVPPTAGGFGVVAEAARPEIRRREAPASGALAAAGLHPVLARVYAARGVVRPEALDYRLAGLPDPASLPGMNAAGETLARAVREGRSIRVIGDFDADGATGTALAVRGLRALGAAQVDFQVPNRLTHGYGLSPELVAELGEPLPDLLLTVDNGIAAHAGIDAAKRRGIEVVVTDHHLPGPTLPAAAAIVNPRLAATDGGSGQALAGVGVMFFVLLDLRRRLRRAGWFGPGRREPNPADWLDLVALGTVADLVPLDGLNRLLVDQGLRRIRAGRVSPGLAALVAVSGRSLCTLSASDLGFAVAPRLNAAGRIDEMSLGVACLLSEDPMRARALAAELDALNGERKQIQQRMHGEAEALLAGIRPRLRAALPAGLVLADRGWHPGVVGLIAARIKEQCHRPTIALAPSGDGAEWKGSARSIPGFHVRDALAAVDARHPGLIRRFGGHAMAAGLTIAESGLPAFRVAFERQAAHQLDATTLQQVLWTDGPLEAQDLSLELAWALRYAGPWGQGFPEPLFDNTFLLEDCRPLGQEHLRLRLRLPGGDPHEAVGFQMQPPWTRAPERVRLVYQLEVNAFRGLYSPRLLIRYLEPA